MKEQEHKAEPCWCVHHGAYHTHRNERGNKQINNQQPPTSFTILGGQSVTELSQPLHKEKSAGAHNRNYCDLFLSYTQLKNKGNTLITSEI